MIRETDLHLYQPPLYQGADGLWRESFIETAAAAKVLTWDPVSVASILALNYASLDRTLFKEIRRKPWLSQIVGDRAEPLDIPPHGAEWKSPLTVARKFYDLLTEEARAICVGKKEVYLLLSGGLDSRIAAGVLARLWRGGELQSRPVCVTWGLDDSRDVAYGREIARIAGFDWQHVPIGPEDVIYSAERSSIAIGALVSPVHCHCMHWFRNASRDALVIAASFGDSVGRAEFSGRHVLELDHLKLSNRFDLIDPNVYPAAARSFKRDLGRLHDRVAGRPEHAQCEVEQQGVYMRNMIAHAMSSINQYASIYQLFTSPRVYGYIWSLHPSLRTNRIYAEMLENIDPAMARVPWARTNRALRGPTIGAIASLRTDFHDYSRWIATDVRDHFKSRFDKEWFAATKLFHPDAIAGLEMQLDRIRDGTSPFGFPAAEKWLALLSMRLMADTLGKPIVVPEIPADAQPIEEASRQPSSTLGKLRARLLDSAAVSPRVSRWVGLAWNVRRTLRRAKLRRRAIRQYPPHRTES